MRGTYSYSFPYNLPPLPTGNYTITITTYEPITGDQIGCLQTSDFLIGLGADSCSYTSSVSATFAGTAQFLDSNTVIQIGPWGPNGEDLGYPWGTFKSVVASADLVGYAFKPANFVWGIRGSINKSVSQDQFDGTMVLGYLPDATNYENALLVDQGVFSWVMTPSDSDTSTPYIFKSGTFAFSPTYYFPTDFPYPLNLGNLGTITISQTKDLTSFTVSATKVWCRCNCDLGGVGHDDSLKAQKPGSSSSLSGYMKGTIAICVIGGLVLIIAIIVIIKMKRSRPRPVVYDDSDLMDPQKPDYGSLAINEAFEAEDQEFN